MKKENEKWVITEVPPETKTVFVAHQYKNGRKTGCTFHSSDLVSMREVLAGDLDLDMIKTQCEDELEVWGTHGA